MVAELVAETQDEQDEAEQGIEESERARYNSSGSVLAHDLIHISVSKPLQKRKDDRFDAPGEMSSLAIYREGSSRRP